jgi:hypothetical protein
MIVDLASGEPGASTIQSTIGNQQSAIGMIRRYTNPEMGAIWSDQRRYETWLEVELAAADAMAEAGIVPREAARDLRARAAFDIPRI